MATTEDTEAPFRRQAVLRPGLVTAIGSLPHTDPDAAARLVLDVHPELPAAPQLPGRSPAEGMLAQVLTGVPGVMVRGDGSLAVDPYALDAGSPVHADTGGDGYTGLRRFLAAAAGRTGPVKVQLAGPVTVGLALLEAGAPEAQAFPVAVAAVRAHARAVVAAVRAALPEAPLVAFVDEPGLTAVGRSRFPLTPDDTVDLLSGALAVLEPHALTGVHCCGPTDWRLAVQAGPQVLALPAEPFVLDAAASIGAFIEEGGWVAWGAVPTTGPVGTDADRSWRRLAALWCDLVRAGCDPVALRTRALVTPACGLAGHGASQAERVLRLAAELADRVHDQAVAVRLSAGA